MFCSYHTGTRAHTNTHIQAHTHKHARAHTKKHAHTATNKRRGIPLGLQAAPEAGHTHHVCLQECSTLFIAHNMMKEKHAEQRLGGEGNEQAQTSQRTPQVTPDNHMGHTVAPTCHVKLAKLACRHTESVHQRGGCLQARKDEQSEASAVNGRIL